MATHTKLQKLKSTFGQYLAQYHKIQSALVQNIATAVLIF